eukprot:3473791-Prymnesium_polylepis.1
MAPDYGDTLENAATFISWLFIVEMVIKLTGLGCTDYWRDGWNRLDGSIVLLSILEMALTLIASGAGVKL